MKEALFILVVIAILLALTAVRYRKQIVAVIGIWRMLRSGQIPGQASEKQVESEKAASGPLVKCVKCGKWIAESLAFRLGKGNYYCSSVCVEKSATAS